MTEKVRIQMEKHGQGRVFIDDVEVHGITSFSFNAKAGEANELTISFMPNSIEFDGVADVTSLGDSARYFQRQ